VNGWRSRGLVVSLMVPALVLFSAAAAVADSGPGVVIPCTEHDWEVDGAVCDAERAASADVPTGAGLPLSARSMSCDDDLYLAFEAEGEWDEIFAVFDNGDGSLYDTGDTIVRCSPQSCEQWEYVGPYDFEEVCQLPSAVSETAVEVELPMECVQEGEGALVVGMMRDEVELISDPIDVSFGECAEEAPPLPTETPVGGQPVAAAATATPPGGGAPVEPQPSGAGGDGLPGWLLPLLGLLGLGGLLALLFWLLGRKRKKRDPCEEWWNNCVESPPVGYERGARASCDNGRKPRVDPKAERIAKLEEGIRTLEEQPPSPQRDKNIETLRGDVWSAKNMSDTTEVRDSDGADLSATVRGVPEGVPHTMEWIVDTRDGKKPIGTGTKAHLSPQELKKLADSSPVTGVVRTYVAVTVCPGTPYEKTFWSPCLQIVPLPEAAYQLGEMKWQ